MIKTLPPAFHYHGREHSLGAVHVFFHWPSQATFILLEKSVDHYVVLPEHDVTSVLSMNEAFQLLHEWLTELNATHENTCFLRVESPVAAQTLKIKFGATGLTLPCMPLIVRPSVSSNVFATQLVNSLVF